MSAREGGQRTEGAGEPKSARRGPRGGHETPGPPGLIGTGEKAKDFKGSFKRLVKTLRPERTLIIVVILLAAVSAAGQIAAPEDHGRGHKRHRCRRPEPSRSTSPPAIVGPKMR